MGHGLNTDLVYTTYQVPDCPVDDIFSCYTDEGDEYLDVTDLHSSAAWNRTQENTLDVLLNQAIQAYTLAEQQVFVRFGSRTWTLDESTSPSCFLKCSQLTFRR